MNRIASGWAYLVVAGLVSVAAYLAGAEPVFATILFAL